jgi:hypothetical protein
MIKLCDLESVFLPLILQNYASQKANVPQKQGKSEYAYFKW